jgi:hypothetical protein
MFSTIEFLFKNFTSLHHGNTDPTIALQGTKLPSISGITQNPLTGKCCPFADIDRNDSESGKTPSYLKVSTANSIEESMTDLGMDTDRLLSGRLGRRVEKIVCEDRDESGAYAWSVTSSSKDGNTVSRFSQP